MGAVASDVAVTPLYCVLTVVVNVYTFPDTKPETVSVTLPFKSTTGCPTNVAAPVVVVVVLVCDTMYVHGPLGEVGCGKLMIACPPAWAVATGAVAVGAHTKGTLAVYSCTN